MTRISGVLAVMFLTILAAGCASSQPAGVPAGRSSQPEPSSQSAVPAAASGDVRALAKRYLAIALPANRRLDVEVDGYTDHRRDDLAVAEQDLRAEAATERRFDSRLIEIPFPSRIAVMVWALVQLNQSRAALTDRQARSVSVSQLVSFDSRHKAADAAVEVDVRAIRRALRLPPPDTS
jgi:hypothetical protein